MRTRLLLVGWLSALAACGPGSSSGGDAGSDAGTDAGADAGIDAGVPTVKTDHSLFWVDPLLLDEPAVISFAKVMATISSDGHGGKLMDAWFHRFNTTPSVRAYPAQFVDTLAVAQGADPSKWDLSALMFKVTGVHNRIDLAALNVGGHCGELRVSIASVNPELTPFHMLFLFRQPARADDLDPAGVHCAGTARRWADLSLLEGAALRTALRQLWAETFTRDNFLLAETVEQTLGPWEWRQWAADSAGALQNPALFQQVDYEQLNLAGPARDAFLGWVRDNAAALDARTILIPEKFRPPSARMPIMPRVTLSLAGLDAATAAQYPNLRKQLELVGCAGCHTADADFVQTKPERFISKFYEKELLARERHLEKLARGEKPGVPFGPLQAFPVLPE
jgi:hypothetical protein